MREKKKFTHEYRRIRPEDMTQTQFKKIPLRDREYESVLVRRFTNEEGDLLEEFRGPRIRVTYQEMIDSARLKRSLRTIYAKDQSPLPDKQIKALEERFTQQQLQQLLDDIYTERGIVRLENYR
jgi:hypothetical protein